MKITIIRTNIGAEVTMGELYQNGKLKCCTLERTQVMLPQGIYLLRMRRMYLTHGNGACCLKGPDIIVGDYRCHGLLIHSQQVYDRLSQRIRKSLREKKEVVLEVKDGPDC